MKYCILLQSPLPVPVYSINLIRKASQIFSCPHRVSSILGDLFTDAYALQCPFRSRSIDGGAFFSALVEATSSKHSELIIQCSTKPTLKYFCSTKKCTTETEQPSPLFSRQRNLACKCERMKMIK